MRCDRCGRFVASLWPALPRMQPSEWGVMQGEERVFWCTSCIETEVAAASQSQPTKEQGSTA